MSTSLKFHLPQPEFLTQEQKNLIRVDLSDEQRKGRGENLIVKGYGGTGKTVVAYYRAYKHKDLNKKVLFLCFNKLLNAHLKGETDILLGKNCDVMYLDEFYKQKRKELAQDIEDWKREKIKNGQNNEDNFLFKEGSFTNSGYTNFLYYTKKGEKISGTTLAKKQSEEFLNIFFDYFLNKNQNNPLYEEIIIDEGQDLSLAWIKVLQKITPHVSIFADDNQQINGGCTITQMKEILLPKGEVQILTRGMRTTKEIFEYAVYAFLPEDEQASALETADTCRSDKTSKPSKNWLYATSTSWNTHVVSLVRKILSLQWDQKLDFDDILIVCPKQEHINLLEQYFCKDKIFPSIYYNGVIGTLFNGWKKGKNENIKITTYQSAKGLEADIVIIFITKEEYLAFLKGEKGDLGDHTFYVLATRARKRVYFVTDFQKEELEEPKEENTEF